MANNEQAAVATETVDDEGNIAAKVYDATVSVHRNQFTLTIPIELAEMHGFRHTQQVLFTPNITVFDDVTGEAEVSFEVSTMAGDAMEQSEASSGEESAQRPQRHSNRRNAMRVWTDERTARLTFPKEFTTSLEADTLGEGRSSLYETAADGDLSAKVRSLSKGTVEIEFVPSALTWTIPNDGGTAAFEYNPQKEWPVKKTLVEYKAGPGVEYDALRVELPREFAHPQVLELEGGEPVATRLSHVDGEPVLVLDFNVGESELEFPHVRTLFRSDWIKVGGKDYEQFRLLFSKPWAHALGWDADTPLGLEPGAERIVVGRYGAF